jgi:hypothetical protein
MRKGMLVKCISTKCCSLPIGNYKIYGREKEAGKVTENYLLLDEVELKSNINPVHHIFWVGCEKCIKPIKKRKKK